MTDPTYTYENLDQTSARVAEVMAGIWVLRETMPDVEWRELFVAALTSLLVQAEATGRAWGGMLPPLNGDPIMPPMPSSPYRPIPDDFTPKVSLAPAPDKVLGEARVAEIKANVEKATATLLADPAVTESPVKVQVEKPLVNTEKPSNPKPVRESAKVEAPRQAPVSHATDQITVTEKTLPDRVERMVKDEAVSQVQRGLQDGARAKGQATGYRRKVNPDCCELCFWLWKEGYVYPIAQPMHRHIGCRCVPEFTTDKTNDFSNKDETGQRLMDRYTSGTLRETSFRNSNNTEEKHDREDD